MIDDLISRSALAASLQEDSDLMAQRARSTDAGFLAVGAGITLAMAALEAAPTVSAVQWIPTAERLPIGPGPYLYANARGAVGMGTPALIRGGARIGDVIAWAELPEPYKEDKPNAE